MSPIQQTISIILLSAICQSAYVVSPAGMNWAAAQTYCVDKGGMASIHSCADNDAARALCLTASVNANCWIGLTNWPRQWDDGTNIDYGFIDNDGTIPVPGAGNPWAKNEPNGPNTQCVFLAGWAHFAWDDKLCSGTSRALCNGLETYDPTIDPTIDPTSDPTIDPTRDPTIDPTVDPTIDPTTYPTADPVDSVSDSLDGSDSSEDCCKCGTSGPGDIDGQDSGSGTQSNTQETYASRTGTQSNEEQETSGAQSLKDEKESWEGEEERITESEEEQPTTIPTLKPNKSVSGSESNENAALVERKYHKETHNEKSYDKKVSGESIKNIYYQLDQQQIWMFCAIISVGFNCLGVLYYCIYLNNDPSQEYSYDIEQLHDGIRNL